MTTSESFSLDEIRIIQTRQLRKTVYYLYERSPYYRDLMDREGIQPADIKDIDDLRHFPTTCREDISREGNRFLCIRPEEVADTVATAGTTHAPLFVRLAESDLLRLAYNEQISLRLTGLEPLDVVLLTTSLDRCNLAGIGYYHGLRRLGSGVMRVGPVPPALLLRLLDEGQATALIGTPAYFIQLVRYAQDVGLDQRLRNIKRLICVSEAIRKNDFSLSVLGERLVHDWHTTLFSLYTVTEIQTSFCECEAGQGGHIHPELMQLEIVDEQGRLLPEGTIGEVCVTPFGITGSPLLRYRTGDYSFLVHNECACGRMSPRLGPILGRSQQRVYIQQQAWFLTFIHEIIQAAPEIRQHVLVVESHEQGNDRLVLLLETTKPAVIEHLRQSLPLLVSNALDIQQVSPEQMQTLQNQGEAQPRRIFIDRRQPQ
jgi:phenylacetate-CoA ligase